MNNKAADEIAFTPQEILEIEVLKGLTSEPKFLSSKFFYDQKGDKLFQEIMNLPEYYLTRTELLILQDNKDLILDKMLPSEQFDLVDLGAGDGHKTKVLLNHFRNRTHFSYYPVDISKNAIQQLSRDIKLQFPEIPVNGISQPFSYALRKLNADSRKLILFLGASIGNYTFEESISFLSKIRQTMKQEDYLLIGFDLRKDPEVILAAYNDKAGVKRKFNLNLLERLNRELNANFEVNNFRHSPEYDSEAGEARSYLESLNDQIVDISALELSIRFRKGEKIKTEISKKYSFAEIEALALASGFQVEQDFTDSRTWFTDSLWKLKS